jgi:hypothetical protein
MKAAIRSQIYSPRVPVQVRIAPRKLTAYDLRRKAELQKEKQYNDLPSKMYLDRQTEEQIAQRELAAKAELFRFQNLLANAVPDGHRCLQKACPFPALLSGECRKHAMDRHAQLSLMGSSLNAAMEWAEVIRV